MTLRRGIWAYLAVASTVVSAGALSAGCGKPRPVEGDLRACATWKDDIGPALAQKCAECHAGGAPAGGYDVTTYLLALREESGKVIAAAGDARSPLLTMLHPDMANAAHKPFASLYQDLHEWVVDCDVAYTRTSIHDRGIMNPDPANSEFHGQLSRRQSYEFKLCADCHGEDFAGGKSGVSCLTCHKEGPTGCTTCHGTPPSTGAHKAHAAGAALSKKLDCGECHMKPVMYTDVGHVFDADKKVDVGSPDFHFGALAKTDYPAVPRKGPPAFNEETGRCENVYCHGGVFADTNAKASPPSWMGGAAQGQCGACHGLPPSSHKAGDKCEICHAQVSAPGFKFASSALHLDGKVQIGDGSDSCAGCHGSGPLGAPPRDLEGKSDPKSITIGAHAAHLKAAHQLRGPVACVDCHSVPAKVDSPGHIDSTTPAEVFPDSTKAMSLAFADGAQPSWDRGAGTCTNSYCHGGGKKLLGDGAPSVNRKPIWTGDTGQAACGACHGVPPVDENHVGVGGLQDCVRCHAKAIDNTGRIIVTGAPGMETSAHINGVVDGK